RFNDDFRRSAEYHGCPSTIIGTCSLRPGRCRLHLVASRTARLARIAADANRRLAGATVAEAICRPIEIAASQIVLRRLRRGTDISKDPSITSTATAHATAHK